MDFFQVEMKKVLLKLVVQGTPSPPKSCQYPTINHLNSAPPAPARPASSRPARIQSRALKEDLSPEDEIDVPIPSSPKIRPTTHIYR